MHLTLDDIRDAIKKRPMWAHALIVIDVMEDRAEASDKYAEQLRLWLSDDSAYSTVHLRDVLCEPLRYKPSIRVLGENFNPGTEWHNTWMPLDTAIVWAREAHLAEQEDATMSALPTFGMF